MSGANLSEGPYGNGIQVEIAVQDRQWIETDERLNYHGWPTVPRSVLTTAAPGRSSRTTAEKPGGGSIRSRMGFRRIC